VDKFSLKTLKKGLRVVDNWLTTQKADPLSGVSALVLELVTWR
jgi:hypothetical protein